jgi:ribosome maturation factor RimP
MEGWKFWIGKKVFIVLKNKRTYSGTVLDVEEKEFFAWITINDKFDNRVSFNSEEISIVEEER